MEQKISMYRLHLDYVYTFEKRVNIMEGELMINPIKTSIIGNVDYTEHLDTLINRTKHLNTKPVILLENEIAIRIPDRHVYDVKIKWPKYLKHCSWNTMINTANEPGW